jgi:hypothetical protein
MIPKNRGQREHGKWLKGGEVSERLGQFSRGGDPGGLMPEIAPSDPGAINRFLFRELGPILGKSPKKTSAPALSGSNRRRRCSIGSTTLSTDPS